MQVENSSAALKHSIRQAQTSSALRITDIPGEERPAVSKSLEIESESPKARVEEIGDGSSIAIARQVETEQSEDAMDDFIDEEIDNDPSHDNALALHVDLLSLQNKVSMAAANTLTVASPFETSTPDLELAVDGQTLAQIPNQVSVLSQSPPREEPITFTDHEGRRYTIPWTAC